MKGTQTRTKRRSATARFKINRFVVFFICGFAITYSNEIFVLMAVRKTNCELTCWMKLDVSESGPESSHFVSIAMMKVQN